MNDAAQRAREHGYEPLAGGMTNQWFVHHGRGEILRLAATDDPQVHR